MQNKDRTLLTARTIPLTVRYAGTSSSHSSYSIEVSYKGFKERARRLAIRYCIQSLGSGAVSACGLVAPITSMTTPLLGIVKVPTTNQVVCPHHHARHRAHRLYIRLRRESTHAKWLACLRRALDQFALVVLSLAQVSHLSSLPQDI